MDDLVVVFYFILNKTRNPICYVFGEDALTDSCIFMFACITVVADLTGGKAAAGM